MDCKDESDGTSACLRVKSGSTNQEMVAGSSTKPDYKYNEDHEFTFVPQMEQGQIIAFVGDRVWHGSPVMDGYDGDRDALVLRVLLKEESVGIILSN
jgi:hypothetical protein